MSVCWTFAPVERKMWWEVMGWGLMLSGNNPLRITDGISANNSGIDPTVFRGTALYTWERNKEHLMLPCLKVMRQDNKNTSFTDKEQV